MTGGAKTMTYDFICRKCGNGAHSLLKEEKILTCKKCGNKIDMKNCDSAPMDQILARWKMVNHILETEFSLIEAEELILFK